MNCSFYCIPDVSFWPNKNKWFPDFSGNRLHSGHIFLQETPTSDVVQQPCWVLHTVRQEYTESVAHRCSHLWIDEKMDCNEAQNTESSCQNYPVRRETVKDIVWAELFTIKWVFAFAELFNILESVHYFIGKNYRYSLFLCMSICPAHHLFEYWWCDVLCFCCSVGQRWFDSREHSWCNQKRRF